LVLIVYPFTFFSLPLRKHCCPPREAVKGAPLCGAPPDEAPLCGASSGG